jgi:hypothetical protein
MKVSCVHGAQININSDVAMGFDAFSANTIDGIFTLCDGANSCTGSGLAAQWLSEAFAQNDAHSLAEQLQTKHTQMCSLFPETGSTLVRVHVHRRGIELSSIGDSFLWLFQKPWGGWAPWQCIERMPRDIDAMGHPTQMIGSEVCDHLHIRCHPPLGRYCAVLMSDGPGLAISEKQLKQRVSLIGRDNPNQNDLEYLCQSLALDALNSGCKDDISVAMVWANYH